MVRLQNCRTLMIVITLVVAASAQGNAGSITPSDTDLPVVSLSLTLNQAIELSDHDNPGILLARADHYSAQAEAESAVSATKLSASSTTYATVGSAPNILTSAIGVSPQNIISAPSKGFLDQNLTIMLPIYNGGSLGQRTKSAAALSVAAQADSQAVNLTVHESVVNAYVGRLVQSTLVAAAQSKVDLEEGQLKNMQAKVDTGKLAPVDLLREQAELADSQSELVQAQTESELALADLREALGVSQLSDIKLSDSLSSLIRDRIDAGQIAPSLKDSLTAAEKNRPEIVAAQMKIESANAEIRASNGQFSPQVDAVGMADWSGNQGQSGNSGYTIGLAASLPLVDGGLRAASLAIANAKQQRAVAEMKAAKQTIERQVFAAWYALQTTQSRVDSANAGVTAATQGYTLAELRYDAGKSTLTESLDALSALSRARADLAKAQGDFIISSVKYQLIVGQKIGAGNIKLLTPMH